MEYKSKYTLLITGGMAPIKLEVCADEVEIEDGVFIFKVDNKVIAYYPFNNTIISDIDTNPEYEKQLEELNEQERERHRDEIDAMRRNLLRNRMF